MILTIIVFILILGLLIFVHELGHFITAKKAGVKVEEFGFGYPPRIFGIKKGETIYSLNLFPIGGFVKIFGEDGEEKKTRSKRAFYNKPIWQRAIILVAGVAMNLVLAAILFSIIHGAGIPSLVQEGEEANYKNIQVQVVEVAKNSPAEESGLKMGDAIVGLSFQDEAIEVKEIDDVQTFISNHLGEEVIFNIKRGKDISEKIIVPRFDPPEGEGATGIAMAKTGLVSYPWYESIWLGIKTTGQMFVTMISLFYLLIKALIFKGTMIGEIAGPVGIFNLTSQMVNLGWIYVLQFSAILSINLALLNILPIPALDGGRLLFLLIEKIKGKPIKFKVEQTTNAIGFAIVILLMIIVTLRDVIKLF